MSIVKLAGIKKLFGGSAQRGPSKSNWPKKLCDDLARATASDTNIKSVGSQSSRVLTARTGENSPLPTFVSLQIQLYEKAPLNATCTAAQAHRQRSDRHCCTVEDPR